MDPTMQFLMGNSAPGGIGANPLSINPLTGLSMERGGQSAGGSNPLMQMLMQLFGGEQSGQGAAPPGAAGGASNPLMQLLQQLGIGGIAGGQQTGGAAAGSQGNATGGIFNPTSVPQRMPSSPADMTQQLGAQAVGQFGQPQQSGGGGLFNPPAAGNGLFAPPQTYSQFNARG